MELTKKQVEFYTAILVLCIIFAVAITLVDYGIKASILEQSNALRLRIEEWERNNGRQSTGANEVRTNHDSGYNPPLPGDVLVDNSPRMEEGNASKGNASKARNTPRRRTKPSGQTDPRTIPNGDK
jgi:hypothetical protein